MGGVQCTMLEVRRNFQVSRLKCLSPFVHWKEAQIVYSYSSWFAWIRDMYVFYVYIYIYIRKYTYVYIYILMYIYIYTYIYFICLISRNLVWYFRLLRPIDLKTMWCHFVCPLQGSFASNTLILASPNPFVNNDPRFRPIWINIIHFCITIQSLATVDWTSIRKIDNHYLMLKPLWISFNLQP